jgi:ABC-type uncharacterized transport system permease subunit
MGRDGATDMDQVRVIEGLAVLAQLPAVAALLRRPEQRGWPFWASIGAAATAAVIVAAMLAAGGWQSGLVATMWTTLAGTLVVYLLVAAITRVGWRLAPLVGAYATGVAGLSFIIAITADGDGHTVAAVPSAWFTLHIVTAVATFALVTLAAITAFAGWIQLNALKSKHPTRLSRLLPSLSECEALSLRLLVLGVAVLAIGLATGIAIEYVTTGHFLAINHKSVLTVAAFLVLGALLALHYGTGMRGRSAVRVVLLGYVLLVLGYIGVKFVTDVLLAV